MSGPSILALDLSLTATGWATIRGNVRGHGLVPTPAKLREGARLAWIRDDLRDITATYLAGPPALVVIEDLPMHAKSAGLTGQLHGAMKLHAHDAGWAPPVLIPAATLKTLATGRGNATKIDMVVAARDRLGYDGTDDNVADAMWLLEVGLHIVAPDHAVSLPKSHLRALDKARPRFEVS